MKLGLVLAPVYNTTVNQLMFLNIFKCGSCWQTTNASAGGVNYTNELYSSNLDANGYVLQLPAPTGHYAQIWTNVLSSIPTDPQGDIYPAGNYALWYDGTATFGFLNDATVVGETAQDGTTGTGRIIIHVTTPTTAGISIGQASTGAGAAQGKNFRLYYTPTVSYSGGQTTSSAGGRLDPYEIAAETNHQIFNMDYIGNAVGKGLNGFSGFRFMEWNQTYNNDCVNWSDRTPAGWVFWPDLATKGGEVPYEVEIALCNLLNVNYGWFNLPINATDSFASSLATLLLSGNGSAPTGLTAALNGSISVYTELGNELWLWPGAYVNQPRGSFDGTISWTGAADVAFRTAGAPQFSGSGGWSAGQLFHGYGMVRQYQTNKAFHDTFVTAGQGSRHFRTIADQSGAYGTWTSTLDMTAASLTYTGTNSWSGALGTHFDAAAGSFYFNNFNWYPLAWSGMGATGITNAFSAMVDNVAINLPTNASSFVTATAIGGGALGSGWTACQAATGNGTVANGDVVSVKFPVASAGSGTITLRCNDGADYPICDTFGSPISAGNPANTSAAVCLCFCNQDYNGTFHPGGSNGGWVLFGQYGDGNRWPSGGEMGQANGWNVAASAYAIGTYGLQYVGYEGGQQLANSSGGAGPGGDYSLSSFFEVLNRDSGMEAVYATWLAQCVACNFTLINHTSDVEKYSAFFWYGMYENSMQIKAGTETPKHDAMVDFLFPGSVATIHLMGQACL